MKTLKIDKHTVVPLGWIMSGYIIMLSLVITGTFWVAKVGYRLERIERFLNIQSDFVINK